jgi:glycosyltransferase involved in cell wall biosynthesis
LHERIENSPDSPPVLARRNGADAGRRGLRVVLWDPSEKGGVSQYTHHLAEHLSLLGNEVTVATGEKYELKQLPRSFKLRFLFRRSWVKSLLFPGRVSGGAGSIKSRVAGEEGARFVETETKESLHASLKNIRRRLVDLKLVIWLLWSGIDVVHFQWSVNRDGDYRLMKLLKALGIKVFYTAHDLAPHRGYSTAVRHALAKIYGIADGVIVHSESNRREIAELFGLNPAKVFVVPHGSDEVFSRDRSVSKADARRDLGIGPEKQVILFFGFIKRYKGLEHLVAAFEEVKRRLPDAFLLIAGQIYRADKEGCDFYSRLIDGLKGRADVLCVPQYIPVESIGDYFAASDVVVLPYVKSYTSGVLLAAYAAGRPVIVTDTGGLAEVVEPGKSGYVVPPADVPALAAAIDSVFEAPTKPARLAITQRLSRHHLFWGKPPEERPISIGSPRPRRNAWRLLS